MLYYLSTPVGEDCLAYSGDSGSWVTALKKNETLRLNRPISWIGWADGSYIFPEGNSADIALFTESSMRFHDARITPAADALSLEENERIKKEKGDQGVLESGKTIYDGMTRSGSQLLLWEARKGDLYMYLHDFEELPPNFVTKKEAGQQGWSAGKDLSKILPGCSIGGDKFGNFEGLLPEKSGRQYYECDVNYTGGSRGAERLVFSSDGLIYYTEDHYESYTQLYDGWANESGSYRGNEVNDR